MTAAITTHLWQSTIFAAAVAVLALAFRGSRARVRYGLWFVASVKFLLPLAPLVALGAALQSTRATDAPLSVVTAVAWIGQPVLGGPLLASPMIVDSFFPAASGRALAVVWICGLIAVALVRLRTWRRVRAAIELSVPAAVARVTVPGDVRVRTVPGLLEPAVAGLWRHNCFCPKTSIDTSRRPS